MNVFWTKKADFGRDEPKSADAVFDLCGEDDPEEYQRSFLVKEGDHIFLCYH